MKQHEHNDFPIPVESYCLRGIMEIPEISPGIELGSLLVRKYEPSGGFEHQDIIVVASKIVSKAEDRFLSTRNIVVTKEAIELSEKTGKPQKICQIIINESVAYKTNDKYLIATTKHGLELSSAGVDRISDDLVLLLPLDPDESAKKIGKSIEKESGKKVAVIISDSYGRPDRFGAGAVAIGCYGITPLRVSTLVQESGKVKYLDETLSDLIAAAAAVIMGQRGRGIPAVCVRGIQFDFDERANIKSILHFTHKTPVPKMDRKNLK